MGTKLTDGINELLAHETERIKAKYGEKYATLSDKKNDYQKKLKEITDSYNNLSNYETPDCLICVAVGAVELAAMVNKDVAAPSDTITMGGHDWRILKRKDGKALIITEKVIDRRRFDGDWHDSNEWKISELRRWLNGEFLEMFSLEERKRIKKVTLLSFKQARKYFKDDKDRIAVDENGELSWWWLRTGGYDNNMVACVEPDGDVDDFGNGVGDNTGGIRPAMWVNADVD